MNEIIKAMEERRSIRKFKPDMQQKKIWNRLLKLDYMLQMVWENRQPSQLR